MKYQHMLKAFLQIHQDFLGSSTKYCTVCIQAS